MRRLTSIDTHIVAQQTADLIRLDDGTITVEFHDPEWCVESPFPAPYGDLWHATDDQWGTTSDVPRWAGDPDLPPSVADTVALGDVPDLRRAVAALRAVEAIVAILSDPQAPDWSADTLDDVAWELQQAGFGPAADTWTHTPHKERT
jgi:hypothetical protein